MAEIAKTGNKETDDAVKAALEKQGQTVTDNGQTVTTTTKK